MASRIRRTLVGRRRWLVAGAAAVVLAGGGTATALAVADHDEDGGRGIAAAVYDHDEGDGKGKNKAKDDGWERAASEAGLRRAVDAALKAVPGGRPVSTELDDEDGTTVWEVEVRTADGVEHEVTVDAGSGKVLANTVDRDDHDDSD
ncbi:PepSY domain-containing protein [Streptomyces sp. AV19]|uniref:PepSY domain-containing protein n=1 Tax=Streptomyces sp. AV19 TaxID=2793068 RepID=UPI0018FE44E1|nr:PepSY domain-containing protein [Streptomyces sp. AV19]MBH1937557.1 PepSY domain-containing protein [Streptomyces sp. AV19]MDG4536437.1 PepSY domain-containing protein [Streptomyces sp. AV19]